MPGEASHVTHHRDQSFLHCRDWCCLFFVILGMISLEQSVAWMISGLRDGLTKLNNDPVVTVQVAHLFQAVRKLCDNQEILGRDVDMYVQPGEWLVWHSEGKYYSPVPHS